MHVGHIHECMPVRLVYMGVGEHVWVYRWTYMCGCMHWVRCICVGLGVHVCCWAHLCKHMDVGWVYMWVNMCVCWEHMCGCMHVGWVCLHVGLARMHM